VLRCAAKHVDDTGGGIRRSRLAGHDISHPLQPHGIRAHGHVADFILVTWETHPLVGSLTKHDKIALRIHVGNRGVPGDVERP
jgi:hypothetical protein